ncbi:MAG: hypothetical protein JKY65_03855 [Planctomycetes bacterium]|nr:hypothetical protein [Planctomycetota bacterium]
MLGSEVPDLSQTPCTHCGESLEGAGEVRWDPWHRGDTRWAALPYHLSCASEAGVLPPSEPGPDQSSCGRCELAIQEPVLSPAFAALHERFLTAKATLAAVEIVWRVAARDPRRYQAEHFSCVLGAVRKKTPRRPTSKPAPEPEEPPSLPSLGG